MATGAATYAAAAVLQRAAPFLLLPLLTRYLTPAEFGQVGILTTIAAGVTVVVGLGLESAIFRGYIRASDEPTDARAFVSTVGGFALVASVVFSLIMALVVAPVLGPRLDVPVQALRLAAVGACLATTSTLVPLALLRAQERLRDYLKLTGVQVLVTPLLTVLFVVGFDWGPTGWMLAYMLGAAVLLLRGLLMIRDEWAPSFDARHLRAALAFGLPLIPHAAAHWGLSVSDRVILGAYLPVADVGAYYAAYVMSLPVTLVAVSVSQATQPLYVEASGEPAARSRIPRLITSHVLIVALVAAAAAVVGPPVVLLFLPAAYSDAAGLVGWLAIGAGLFGLYLVPMNIITMIAGRTSRVWIITVLAAIANVGLNVLLIPRVGTIAAAINTAIGYGLLVVGAYLFSRRVCQPPIEWEASRIALGLLMIGLPALAGALLLPGESAIGLLLRGGLMIAVAIALTAIGPLRETASGLRRARRAGREAGRP